MKRDIPREEIEAKLNLAKRELEFAGPIHSRDLRIIEEYENEKEC